MSEALEVRTTSDDASEGTNTLQSSATLVSGQLPTEAFALGETFRTIPDLTVESAPVAAAEEAASMPVMWAQTDDEDLTSTLAQDPSVTAIEELCRTGNRHFYRMEWAHNIHCRMEILLQSQGILRRSRGTNSGWSVDLLYPNRETLRQASECWERFDLPLQIDSISSSPSDQQSQCGLTPVQHKTLTQACKDGYFKVPREISLKELAEKTNISHQALSERLRRGHDTLIKAALLDTYPTPPTVPPAMSPL